MAGRKKRNTNTTDLRIRPADPFELIRWLARSQADPRKAVAELVQNSLDAGARHITVRRARIRKQLCLSVLDDGEGVLPKLEREAALRHLATHIGHSQKLGLDPAERASRVVAGQYGVGLLGFWAVGKAFELRSRVAGSELMALRLLEDSPKGQIMKLPLATDMPPTLTEAIVFDVHGSAQKALSGRRLSEYLASELRGQIVAHQAEIVVHDQIARGRAQKVFPVVPPRFQGEPLQLPETVSVPGFSALRIELYQSRGAELPVIQLACAGTLVAEDMQQLTLLGLECTPWVGHELTGLIDFPDFTIPPGSRRGVLPDSAATAFVQAMEQLAPLVQRELNRLEDERQRVADRNVVGEIRRALRGFQRRLPHYELPEVNPDRAVAMGKSGTASPDQLPNGIAVLEHESGVAPVLEPIADNPTLAQLEEEDEETAAPRSPGPLAAVRISPARARLPPGGQRILQAKALDAHGIVIPEANFSWHLAGQSEAPSYDRGPARPLLSLLADGAVATLSASEDAPLEMTGRIEVTAFAFNAARLEVDNVRGSAAIQVVERSGSVPFGIPEPHLVSRAGAAWRSRMVAGRWEVNDAHEDYVALRGTMRARTRYLLTLFAKEIVLRSSPRLDIGPDLERMAEVLAHAERNLRGK